MKAADSTNPDKFFTQTETYSASFGLAGTVDVKLDKDLDDNHVAGAFPQWRNYPVVTGGPGAAIGNMLGSRWGASSFGTGKTQIRIPMTISDLVNGPYELTMYGSSQKKRNIDLDAVG